MKPNPKQERMHVSEISAGLKALETQLHADGVPLLPFHVACQIYQRHIPHPLVSDEAVLDIPKMREVAMFVAAGMDLIRYHRSVNRKDQMKLLRRHLRLLGPGLFGIAATYAIQQAHGSYLREHLRELGYPIPTEQKAADAARKSIELMVGMAALSCFDAVELEDPDESGSKARNPDVIVRDGAICYGIACKSLASGNGGNFLDRVKEGARQIDDAIMDGNVDPRRGVVLVDISALLDHDKLYNGEGSAPSAFPVGPGGALLFEMNAALTRLFGQPPEWSKLLPPLFADYSLPPGILIYAHSLLICHNEEGGHFPVYQKALMLGYGNDVESIKSFCNRLNDAIHGQVGNR